MSSQGHLCIFCPPRPELVCKWADRSSLHYAIVSHLLITPAVEQSCGSDKSVSQMPGFDTAPPAIRPWYGRRKEASSMSSWIGISHTIKLNHVCGLGHLPILEGLPPYSKGMLFLVAVNYSYLSGYGHRPEGTYISVSLT